MGNKADIKLVVKADIKLKDNDLIPQEDIKAMEDQLKEPDTVATVEVIPLEDIKAMGERVHLEYIKMMEEQVPQTDIELTEEPIKEMDIATMEKLKQPEEEIMSMEEATKEELTITIEEIMIEETQIKTTEQKFLIQFQHSKNLLNNSTLVAQEASSATIFQQTLIREDKVSNEEEGALDTDSPSLLAETVNSWTELSAINTDPASPKSLWS